jgi:predicted nucleotidyltransferase
MKLPVDFRELLEEFDHAGVESVVIGGYAFGFHAEPRATKDLDLLLDGSDENLERAALALQRFGAPANVVAATRSMAESDVVFLGQSPLRVDLLRSVDGVATRDVLRNAIATAWDGTPVRVMALPDLIANKRAAGRPQDLVDVQKLELVQARLAQ